METSGNPKKNLQIILILVIVVLTLGITFVGYLLYEESQQVKDQQLANEIIAEQKTQLEGQLENMIVEYDSLKTSNDSINLQLEKEQEYIRKLLKINASNAYKIKLYQKEMETLRKIMRSYIVQIDSLNTRNQQLTVENVEVRTKLRDIEKSHDELSKIKDELSTKVDIASQLSAKDIIVSPLNKRSREKDKVDKVEKIKVCFTIRENSITEPGTKEVFLRIIRPDDIVLTSGISELFEANGEKMVFSAKRQLEYENQDIDICIFWDKTEELIPGTYTAELYCEQKLIGSSSFGLR